MMTYMGRPIYIATKEIPRRRHRKKRINKKWRKRYGCMELNMMEHGQVIMMDNGVIYMTKKTYRDLLSQLPTKKARRAWK